jgi:hypothetical protein
MLAQLTLVQSLQRLLGSHSYHVGLLITCKAGHGNRVERLEYHEFHPTNVSHKQNITGELLTARNSSVHIGHMEVSAWSPSHCTALGTQQCLLPLGNRFLTLEVLHNGHHLVLATVATGQQELDVFGRLRSQATDGEYTGRFSDKSTIAIVNNSTEQTGAPR